jgi:hypothetical protein
VRCWWNCWLSGTRVLSDEPGGDSRLPLAGVFAGAIAVRQVFASVVASFLVPARETTISLWEPWNQDAGAGPNQFDLPNALWLLGLGHLGQAFVWNLSFLPYRGHRSAVLQDDQVVGEENEATSLLVTAADIGKRKTRVAAHWLEACGWQTALVERRHHGDIRHLLDDPPYLLCGLDRLEPRIAVAKLGFDYMIDAGVGHGPVDFEALQIRVIPKNESLEGLWGSPDHAKRTDELLATKAYEALEQAVGQCGTYTLAEASVAVPFVGAATGALAIAQLIRLGSLKAVPQLLQLELAAPEMMTLSALVRSPNVNLGSEHSDLATAVSLEYSLALR